MNLNDIVTIKDLQEFKQDILAELKEIKKKDNFNKKFLRSAEIRKLFNISSGTLQNMRVNGTLPYFKAGTTILYDFDRVMEY